MKPYTTDTYIVKGARGDKKIGKKMWEIKKMLLFGGHTSKGSFLLESSMRHKKMWQITILSRKVESRALHITKQLIKVSQDSQPLLHQTFWQKATFSHNWIRLKNMTENHWNSLKAKEKYFFFNFARWSTPILFFTFLKILGHSCISTRLKQDGNNFSHSGLGS